MIKVHFSSKEQGVGVRLERKAFCFQSAKECVELANKPFLCQYPKKFWKKLTEVPLPAGMLKGAEDRPERHFFPACHSCF